MNLDIRPTRLTLILVGALAVGIVPPSHAQSLPPPLTLDGQMESLLSSQCSGLGFDPFDPSFPFGPNLTNICEFPPTGAAANSTGGGAASSQASTLSIQKNLVQQRLERAKSMKRGGEPSPSLSGRSQGRSADARSEGSVAPSRRFDIFVSGTYESVDRNVTAFEAGYESSILGGAVGADYQFSDVVVAGLVAGYRKHEGDFGGGGDFTMTAFEPSVFVSVLPSQKTFLQFVAGYGGQNSDVNRAVHFDVDEGGTPRNFDGTVASAADATAYTGGAQFGYDHPAGRFTFGPRIGVNYGRTTVDSYSETAGTGTGAGLALRIDERTVESLQGVAGFFGSAAFSTGSGVVVPQLNVEYVHEFEDETSLVTAQFAEDLRGPGATPFAFLTNIPDSDFFNVEAGVAVVFARGIQLFVNLRTMIGNDNFDSSGGTIGLRFEL